MFNILQEHVRQKLSVDDSLYLLVKKEIDCNYIDQTLWAKALAHSDYDELKAKGFYSRERVKYLNKDKERISRLIYSYIEYKNSETNLSIPKSELEDKSNHLKSKLNIERKNLALKSFSSKSEKEKLERIRRELKRKSYTFTSFFLFLITFFICTLVLIFSVASYNVYVLLFNIFLGAVGYLIWFKYVDKLINHEEIIIQQESIVSNFRDELRKGLDDIKQIKDELSETDLNIRKLNLKEADAVKAKNNYLTIKSCLNAYFPYDFEKLFDE
ncbi:hypothetical protein [Thalassotalea aquiviva]|uniref:hypothetical protein n=1 Tax=Thalassotalea aquiviva TaxID=3242415 RepID=UPI003529D8C2